MKCPQCKSKHLIAEQNEGEVWRTCASCGYCFDITSNMFPTIILGTLLAFLAIVFTGYIVWRW